MSELDVIYDSLLDMMYDVKSLKDDFVDIENNVIYDLLDELYTSLVVLIDRIGQLEVSILQYNQK